ncbi:DNA cytosine methyltransferase [Nesterenkonia sp. K-15-9-6]|uniref:DNA cytosine methyltransferase n=1 Tax=Nesterenkonia sp. K-15-9-6 TaxID=3093918 RepID=UPI004043CE49
MITLTDMFCGAGGSSTGALEVPGIEVRTAMNHWDRAIETHNTNHPTTDHVHADISQVDPRYVGRSDILWASPECTNHSVAKGRRRATNQPDLFTGETIADEAAERSRATMWDVPRFAEHHDYQVIITENVVDAARWVMWDAWLHAMDSLGYDHHVVYLNSMHAQAYGLPAPQSRDRMYVVFWKKGNPAPDFDALRPWAECDTCGPVQAVQSFKNPASRWGRYRAQYVYRCPNTTCRHSIVEPGWLPAASAIDWSIRGQRIGDRARPLAEKTMRRIRAGLAKYAGHRMGEGYRPPLIVNNLSGNDAGRAATAWDPLRTLVAGGLHESLLVPVEGRDGKDARAVHEVMRTQTTRNETGILTPTFLTQFRERVRDLDPYGQPLNTIVADGANYGMVTPAYVMRNNSSTGDGAEMVTPADEALRTLTTKGHQSLVTPAVRNAMVTTMRGTSPGQLEASSRPADQPIGTLTAGGSHHGLTAYEPDVVEVESAEFRMLQPHEITWGMSFPRDYVMLGNKREQVKLAGNAVTPPAARDLIAIAAATLN